MRVAVIGAGVMGAATGWRLARRGVDVVCFDRFSPPHSLGSSHGETRIIRTAYMEGAWYVPLVQEAFPLWRELEAQTGSDLLTMTGVLTIGEPTAESVTGALSAARAHNLNVEHLDADQLRRRYPHHVVGAGDVGVLDKQAGFIRAEAAVAAMLSRVPVLETQTTVASIEAALDRFDAVVVAAGAWASQLIDWLPLSVERQALAWFEIDSAAGLTPDQFPIFYRESTYGDVYGFPTLDGRSMKIARHHEGDRTDPDHLRRDVDPVELAPLHDFIAACLRDVSDRVTRTSVCMYTNTPDGHFIVDFHPDDSRIVLISACSGHGFKFAPVIGDIVADLVCDGGTARDISRFAVSRFGIGLARTTR